MRKLPGGFPGVIALVLYLAVAQAMPAATGSEFVGLREISKELGLEYEPSEGNRSLRLSGDWVSIEFVSASRIVLLNGIKVFLGDPVLVSNGGFYLERDDWRQTLQPILMPRTFPNPPGFRRVTIDAGHGGDDPGGQNTAAGLDEKDLTLSFAKLIGNRLAREGFEVTYTRTDDRFIPLKERPAIASRLGADLFLSIHFNAARDDVRGVETFVYTLQGDPSSARSKVEAEDRISYAGNQNNPWNSLLGFYLQREIVSGTKLPDRGLKRARFAVLEDLPCPGVLLELGFVTNPQTARLLRSLEYRNQLADSVTRGVLLYRKTLMRLHTEADLQ